MKTPLLVQYAVACLQGLDHPCSTRDLSRHQGIPIEECSFILGQFESAGILKKQTNGCWAVARELEDLTVLEVLKALWAPRRAPEFRLLYGQRQRHVGRQTRRLACLTTESLQG
jgi:DNA-binding IscR family transcriptional regulator